jgi:hypothetical protein
LVKRAAPIERRRLDLISPACALLKSSIIRFIRTPSPPPRKSHQITVSAALAAAPSAMTAVAASAA